MENVRSYCDDILDVIHKFGEEYIYDPRTLVSNKNGRVKNLIK